MEVDNLDNITIPKHIAIIMDGNRRWARKKNLPKELGHRAGASTLENISRFAGDLGIKYLSVYAFSTENWNRSKQEVSSLMNLLNNYLDRYIKKADANNLKISFIGDISGLSDKLQEKISRLTSMTRDKLGLNLIIAINYGSHDEILRATKKICFDVLKNKIKPDQINQDLFRNYLDTKDIPDPDLLIRTAGEMRLSNFLLWQLAYSEFYFCDKFWPEFNQDDLLAAIKNFSLRTRKFGGC